MNAAVNFRGSCNISRSIHSAPRFRPIICLIVSLSGRLDAGNRHAATFLENTSWDAQNFPKYTLVFYLPYRSNPLYITLRHRLKPIVSIYATVDSTRASAVVEIEWLAEVSIAYITANPWGASLGKGACKKGFLENFLAYRLRRIYNAIMTLA